MANDGLTRVERGKRIILAGIAVIGAILALLHLLPQEALASAEQKRILALYSQDHGLPLVRGDALQLQAVLLNLTLNAAAAMSRVMPDFLRLVVRTEIREDQGVKVSVRDFGWVFSGIDAGNEVLLYGYLRVCL